MAVGNKKPTATRPPATPTTAASTTPVTVSAKKRKGRRYAKKKKKPISPPTTNAPQTNNNTTTAPATIKHKAPTTATRPPPTDTWRRIVVDPELVSMREVEAAGEGSGMIVLEEISGRAFKGKVTQLTMDDVRTAAVVQLAGEQSGQERRRKKRKRRELVPRLDVMDEEKAAEEAGMDEEMESEVEAVEEEEERDGEEEDGVEFDLAELDGEEDEGTKAATLEAQHILGQMRNDDDDDEEEEEEEKTQEVDETEQVKQEQEEEEDDDEPAAPATTQSQTSNQLPLPDLSSPPPVTAWDAFNLHPLLLHSLHTLGFHTPTPVQSACLPPALVQRRNIIAAAETGSGKTLTYSLPILNGLLLSPPSAEVGGVVALVLVPTRELALQVAEHVRMAARYVEWLKCVVLVGGLSQQKQLRQLAGRPHVLIATPGRLCELIVEGEVKGWNTLRYLVLDEADRMVERGLGAEVQKVMAAIDRQREKVREDGGRVSKLQHFFFSATLALPDVGRENLKLKKTTQKRKRTDGSTADDEEAGMVGFFTSLCSSSMKDSRPHIVDLTSKRRLVGGLSEYIIPCVTDDKDYYVYALLLQQPADTKLILFVNAISCLRRLVSLLTLMTLPVYPLHAEMQQRQRLKNLDRFTAATESAILLCTDVAARGLDLPAVPLVVHYQLPGSADVYIHRVGRTARAGRAGVSVALVSEEDGRAWHRINTVVRGSTRGSGGSEAEVERWKVDDRLMGVSRERMTVARKLDRLLNHQRQHKHNADWITRQAAEMDMIVDDDVLQASKRQVAGRGTGGKGGGGGGEEEAEGEKEEVRRLQKELDGLLKRRVEEDKKHARFYTLNVVEEMEQRAERHKKQAVKEETETRKKQKKSTTTTATTTAVKLPAVKAVQAQKAKVEVVGETSGQDGEASAMSGSSERQQGVKAETEAVVEEEQYKQRVNSATVDKQQSVKPPSTKPTPATKSKQQPAKLPVEKAVSQLQSNGHKESRTEKEEENITADKSAPLVTIVQKSESVQAAAVISTGAKEEKAGHNDTVAQSAVATAGMADDAVAGETKKLSKRAKKNQRKQKQKLAATTTPQPSHDT